MIAFDTAMNWLEGLQKFGIKPGLERMEWMLEKLSHPERRLKFVHIAGTNGKGSTVAFLTSVLREAGYEIGTYTSPAMGNVTNRIQWNGKDIPDDQFANFIERLIPLAEELERTEWGPLTEFETTTLIAILYFAEEVFPDLVIWETGLGGLNDCTNVVVPIVSAITNIGFDHTQILGETKREIAMQKAGIIKNGFPTITTEEDPEALEVIETTAVRKKSPIYRLNKDFRIVRKSTDPDKQIEMLDFYSPYTDYHDLQIPLLGEHQVKNAGLAIMVLLVMREFYAVYFESEDLLEGLKKTIWPGRFEIIKEDPLLILDGAHNLEGIEALSKVLSERFAHQKPRLLFAALEDKDVQGMIQRLSTVVSQVIVTKAEHPRATELENLEMWFRDANSQLEILPIEDWRKAVSTWQSEAAKGDILLATGSLYFISDLRKELGGKQAACFDLKEGTGE
ncbi:bifunctional folylpolyglutamate synthase/dihydrofolate synthase [Ammoniphilus resinae]|uniref:tetrahydrofolate synthase n=1 Tax=Ammoniphilus resinae TaxID=861532 RepID=A0ABS4GKG3_9BACL|nr:folylpolyglutamate synthase/dihydrofolate synthase family protein [Ammoniphilus resinae]MBP1930400.1 dihydrofolate synthase/folylpolyglutamate synthase [Ammoniphilus resinae]